PGAGRLERHQYRGRPAAGARAWAGQDDRHHPGRRRPALSVQALQPGLPAPEEPADTALALLAASVALVAAPAAAWSARPRVAPSTRHKGSSGISADTRVSRARRRRDQS